MKGIFVVGSLLSACLAAPPTPADQDYRMVIALDSENPSLNSSFPSLGSGPLFKPRCLNGTTYDYCESVYQFALYDDKRRDYLGAEVFFYRNVTYENRLTKSIHYQDDVNRLGLWTRSPGLQDLVLIKNANFALNPEYQTIGWDTFDFQRRPNFSRTIIDIKILDAATAALPLRKWVVYKPNPPGPRGQMNVALYDGVSVTPGIQLMDVGVGAYS